MNEDIFISYSRRDKERVFELRDQIESQLGVRCWIDLNGIESDQEFIDTIISAIERVKILVFMYSVNSAQSDWTKKELNFAAGEGKRIVFVNIDGSQLDKWYRFQYGLHDIIDPSDPDQWAKLISNIRGWLNLPAMQAVSPAEPVHEASEPAKTAPVAEVRTEKVDGQRIIDMLDAVRNAKIREYPNGHDYVDLGLPSGTLWATCNIGATRPEDIGSYFSWGETNVKANYNSNIYMKSAFLYPEIRRYCKKDGWTRLDPVDDAASENWQGAWRTPTKLQMEELCTYCELMWVKRSGVDGVLFCRNGRELFLPAAGGKGSWLAGAINNDCDYWTATLNDNLDCNAYYLHLHKGEKLQYKENSFDRRYGMPVRPVFLQEE